LRTELAETLLHPRTRAEQGRADNQADHSPPGSAEGR
jgi:hypothetical protein